MMNKTWLALAAFVSTTGERMTDPVRSDVARESAIIDAFVFFSDTLVANFDVIETRTGDQFRGTLKDATYKINTFYGPVELPAEKVVSVVSIGAVRPRHRRSARSSRTRR